MKGQGQKLVVVIALFAGACSVFASKAELRLVEELRGQPDPFLQASILDEYDGRFGETGRLGSKVAPLRPVIEEAFWKQAVDRGLTEPAVRDYLDRYPQGAHAEEAERRLDQLRFFAEADAARREAKRRAEEEERRRAEELNERERAKVRTGLERWLRTALQLPRWGTTLEALAALDDSFREQWEGGPEPLCVEETCRKTITAGYFFARTGSTRIDRSISLVLQVDMRGRRVYRITGYYTGRGFVDWLEMSSGQIIAEATEEDREAARDAMLVMAQGTVASIWPTASEIETEEEGVLLMFRHEDMEMVLREFPPTYAAGRVDGFQVTFTGELPELPPEPPPPPPEPEPEPEPEAEPQAEPEAEPQPEPEPSPAPEPPAEPRPPQPAPEPEPQPEPQPEPPAEPQPPGPPDQEPPLESPF